nr:MAG TPA: hypothetical protein [Caudoviricetes sp.]
MYKVKFNLRTSPQEAISQHHSNNLLLRFAQAGVGDDN